MAALRAILLPLLTVSLAVCPLRCVVALGAADAACGDACCHSHGATAGHEACESDGPVHPAGPPSSTPPCQHHCICSGAIMEASNRSQADVMAAPALAPATVAAVHFAAVDPRPALAASRLALPWEFASGRELRTLVSSLLL
jgi:hypothetical protein